MWALAWATACGEPAGEPRRWNQPPYHPPRSMATGTRRPTPQPATPPEETTMNPALHYQVTQARVADRHAQARRDALARHCPPGTACATAPAQASRARVP